MHTLASYTSFLPPFLLYKPEQGKRRECQLKRKHQRPGTYLFFITSNYVQRLEIDIYEKKKKKNPQKKRHVTYISFFFSMTQHLHKKNYRKKESSFHAGNFFSFLLLRVMIMYVDLLWWLFRREGSYFAMISESVRRVNVNSRLFHDGILFSAFYIFRFFSPASSFDLPSPSVSLSPLIIC